MYLAVDGVLYSRSHVMQAVKSHVSDMETVSFIGISGMLSISL
jgi:hypothetical protein